MLLHYLVKREWPKNQRNLVTTKRMHFCHNMHKCRLISIKFCTLVGYVNCQTRVKDLSLNCGNPSATYQRTAWHIAAVWEAVDQCVIDAAIRQLQERFLACVKAKGDIVNICLNKSGLIATWFYFTNDICRLLKHLSTYLTIKCCDSLCSWIIENCVIKWQLT